MTPNDAELARLCDILRNALQDAPRLRATVAHFLETFDALPDEADAYTDPSWIAIREAAYDLRYYAPEVADDDSVFLDERAALHRIRQTLEQCSSRLPQN